MIRTYIGETSSTVIAKMPPAERKKSTLKYTAFFVTFTVCTLSLLSGPGKHQVNGSGGASTKCFVQCHVQYVYTHMYYAVGGIILIRAYVHVHVYTQTHH